MANDKKLSQDEKLMQLDDAAAYDAEQEEEEKASKSSAPDKKAKALPDKREKRKSGKPNIFKRIGKWFKDTFNELKKVTWPSFSKTMKQTGVVLGVVLLFLILLFGFDLGLKQLYNLMFIQTPATTTSSSGT